METIKIVNNLMIRCSSLHKIMTKSRSKSSPLSETTKTYVQEQAKENFYGIRVKLESKYFDKGNRNENLAIEMVNQIRFKEYTKNEVRKTESWLTGECDVEAKDSIIDVKCSWSFDSFPCYESEALKIMKRSGYDWQVRGYMYLYDKPTAEVIWCMTSTPSDLMTAYDDPAIHKVDHIDPERRMTAVKVDRDPALEELMITQYNLANEYYKQCILELQNKNKL